MTNDAKTTVGTVGQAPAGSKDALSELIAQWRTDIRWFRETGNDPRLVFHMGQLEECAGELEAASVTFTDQHDALVAALKHVIALLPLPIWNERGVLVWSLLDAQRIRDVLEQMERRIMTDKEVAAPEAPAGTHSPLPWRISATRRQKGHGYNWWLHASDGRFINRGGINTQMDAEFIVHCVNQHDALGPRSELLSSLKGKSDSEMH